MRPGQQAREPGVRALRQPNRKLKPAEIQDLIDRYEAGATMSGLAAEFAMHFQIVRAHLRRSGVGLRSDLPALTSEDIDEAALLYARGWSTYRLADRYAVDRSTVGKALKRVGVELRR